MDVTSVFEKNYDAYNNGTRIVINQGSSRCHSLGTNIRMYDGKLKKVEDIEIGDKIMNYMGNSYNTVTAKHQGRGEMFDIIEGKGNKYTVNGDHILPMKQVTPKTRKTYPTNECNPHGYGLKPKLVPIPFDKNTIHYFSVKEFMDKSKNFKRMYTSFKNNYIELPEKDLLVDPYYLGLWLGDGTSMRGYEVTNIDPQIIDYLYDFCGDDAVINIRQGIIYSMRHKKRNHSTQLSKDMIFLNVIKNKHIPEDYIYSSYEQRLQLIAGLIDSDGHQTGRNTLSFTNKNKTIVEGLYEIIRISGFHSRGIREHTAKINREDGSVYECQVYRIEFNSPDFSDLNKYLKVPRKKVNKRKEYRGEQYNIFNTKIKSINSVGIDNYYGFELDGDKLYLLEDGTVNHNSSKTYSILQLLIIIALTETVSISIVRKSLPSLKKSAMRDFKDILLQYDIPFKENKTAGIFEIGNSFVEFFSIDDESKVRGSKRDILYVNEASELNKLEYDQLAMRTTGTIFLDYNPSDSNHFIIKQLIPQDNSLLIKSTFLDNPFLEQSIIDHILSYKETDEDMWLIYGLGEVASGRDNVFQFNEYTKLPENVKLIGYGLDFGFTNDETAMVKLFKKGKDIYVQQMIYELNMTNPDIVERFKEIGVEKGQIIYADSAEPKSIEEIKRCGYMIKGVKKGPDSIRLGIDLVKRFKIHSKGEGLKNELLNYKWKKDRNGDLLNEPIDKFNDLLDATRYVVYMTQVDPNYGSYSII